MEFNDHQDREEIYSKPVRAGKRTYFFDVKSTKGEDLYLTITESKKRFREDGTFFYEKHKIFLYKEDFEKFSDGLMEALGYIRENQPGTVSREANPGTSNDQSSGSGFTNIEFDDLSK
jgi:hypothetical protein